MRRALLMVLALALSGCTLLSNWQGATLRGEGAAVVFANSGPGAALDVAVYLRGDALMTTDHRCHPQGRGVGCELGDVGQGEAVRVELSGPPQSGTASFYREGSGVPRVVPLQP